MLFPTPTAPLAAFGPLVARRTSEGFGENSQPYESFSLAPVTPTIGAEISGIRLGGDLPEATLAELRRALLEWKVLFFRDQAMDRSAHRNFALRWGALEQHPIFQIDPAGSNRCECRHPGQGRANGGG